MFITVNNEKLDVASYLEFHRRRIELSMQSVQRFGGGETVEMGGHPWVMTSALIEAPGIDLVATVSAEEVSSWPDELPVERKDYTLVSPHSETCNFVNYSANLERTRFSIERQVDFVLVCEIIEHMTRAPHVMLLNANAWLKTGGRILVTTPNGAQFENPLRIKAKMPAFRSSTYSRHNYVFTMAGLIDLIESCGFEIEEAEFLSPYPRQGLSNLYPLIGRLPTRYAREKFNQSLHIVARKTKSLEEASWLPKAYAPGGNWELISGV